MENLTVLELPTFKFQFQIFLFNARKGLGLKSDKTTLEKHFNLLLLLTFKHDWRYVVDVFLKGRKQLLLSSSHFYVGTALSREIICEKLSLMELNLS